MKRKIVVIGNGMAGARVVEEILKRGKVPIVCGGTGLYIKAVIEGIQGDSVGLQGSSEVEQRDRALISLIFFSFFTTRLLCFIV